MPSLRGARGKTRYGLTLVVLLLVVPTAFLASLPLAQAVTLTTGFTYSPSIPAPNLPATFAATAAGGAPPYTFKWAFGDGTTGTASPISHSFASQGNYNVTLTTTDSSGGTAHSSRMVSVRVQGFSFAASGDFGLLTSTTGTNNLNLLQGMNPDFFLGLGDMSSDPAVAGNVWCSEFKAKFNGIQILPGDHDTGGHDSASFGETHSYEKYVSGCPLTLPVSITCGPVVGNCYGKEYYFDYPSVNPIARFIFTSPKIYNITGVCKSSPNCSSQTGQPCTDQYGCWPYEQNDTHYNWVSNALVDARTKGIKWTIVAVHKDCISASDATCSMNKNLFNLLLSNKVDLIIQAHDNAYERSKQLALNTSTCTSMNTDGNGYIVYNSACIVDDGSRGFYAAGSGSVVVIQGAWVNDLYGVGQSAANVENQREAPYFARLMGSNTPGAGLGFTRYIVYADGIDVQTVFSGGFQDSFSILGKRATSTSVTCPATGVIGQTVTCNAVVADVSPGTPTTPTGTVTFTPGGNCTLTGGSCSVGVTPNAAGTLIVSAAYSGDSTHVGSNGSTTVSVNKRLTSTSIVCASPIPVGDGSSCSVTVTDTSPGSSNAPTGLVSLSSNSTGAFNGACTLSGTTSSANCSSIYTPSVGGHHMISASYSGDSSHQGSGPAAFNIATTPGAPHPTTTTVACPSSATVGVAFTCSATVTDTFSSPNAPTGTVTFSPAGSCTLNNPTSNSAGCSVSLTIGTPGSLTVTANYAGDNGHNSSSGSASLLVNARTTSATITCSTPDAVDIAVTCTAIIADTSPGISSTPSGTVAWSTSSSGTFSSSTCTLSSGSCAVNYTPLVPGSHKVTGSYSGDSTHSVSSGFATLAVAVSPTTTSITCSPGSVAINQPTTCRATVTDTSSGPVPPTGTVSFATSGTGLFVSSPCTLASPTATSASCSVTYTPTNGQGTHTITATYNPDSTHADSSAPFGLTVTARETATTINCPNSGVIGVQLSCSARVTDTSPGTASTPTGTVTFNPGGSCTLTAGSCSTTITPAAAGSLTVTASYNGDTSHSASNNSATVNVGKRATSTSITCSPNPVANNTAASCNATVTDIEAGTTATPAGSVSFASNSTGSFGSFSCTLTPTATIGVAICGISYTPTVTGHHAVSGSYGGGSSHVSSGGSFTETVVPVASQPPYALVISSTGKVFKYQNGNLTLIGQPVTTILREVDWKPDGSYALIVGDSGVLLKYDGTQLASIPTSVTTNLYALDWKPDGSYALIGGSGGILFKYDGVSLTRLQNSFTNSIRSINWNPAGTQALMVGSSGAVLVYQAAGQITKILSGTTQYLYSVAWSPNGQYALIAGVNDTVLRYDGFSVQGFNVAGLYSPTVIIHAISWSPDGSFALLVGDLGVVLKYDGSLLTRLTTPVSSDLYSVSWLGGTAYLAGGSGSSLTYESGVFTKLANGTGTSLRGWAWKPS